MKIHFVDLNVFGATDLSNGDIFISSGISIKDKLITLIHEIGHVVASCPDHNKKWLDLCLDIYDIFDLGNISYPKILNRCCLYRSLSSVLNIGNINIGNIAYNIGNITGIQNVLTDYHLLQAYRKFSQKVLGTEGQWEFKGDRQIRLFPTPRGSFPVVVEYMPIVSRFTSPTSRELTKRMIVAELKIMVGNARAKYGNIPAPDGGSLNLNGELMLSSGQEEKIKVVEDAILLGEPLQVYLW